MNDLRAQLVRKDDTYPLPDSNSSYTLLEKYHLPVFNRLLLFDLLSSNLTGYIDYLVQFIFYYSSTMKSSGQ